MIPFRGAVGLFALAALTAGASPLQAAWCNVFQVCCHSCNGQASVSAYGAPDPCNPCPPPPPVCTTRYVQRCYYQPVTCYQTKTYYEPVTTYRTSYYYEPVTSYRYSMYFDPCTCCYQQVACPTTCYRLRSQCCPVQSWVQRCCQVPVTTYQQAFYYEPVTTCCTPTCNPCPPASAPAASGAEVPGVQERTSPGPGAGVQEAPNGSFYSPADPRAKVGGSSYRQIVPAAPVQPTPPPPTVRLERVVAAPNSGVEGQVVTAERQGKAGARLLFVSAERQGVQEKVTADNAGRFRALLASGDWLVYVYGADGKPLFHRRVEVRSDEPARVTLVSR